jgi:biopolymer transport protein ExbD
MAFSQRGRAEINVTPLIDVLLVLLVIFLIVMPSLVKFEEVATPEPPADGDALPSLVVRVRADLSVVLVDEGLEIPLDSGAQLAVGLRQHVRERHHVVFVELDDEVPWGEVVSAVDTIRGVAPMTRVALKVPEE